MVVEIGDTPPPRPRRSGTTTWRPRSSAGRGDRRQGKPYDHAGRSRRNMTDLETLARQTRRGAIGALALGALAAALAIVQVVEGGATTATYVTAVLAVAAIAGGGYALWSQWRLDYEKYSTERGDAHAE